jgi:GAF domain-containing protein
VTIPRGRARDQQRWVAGAAVVMAVVATFDRLTGERLHAPVGAVLVGPMVAAVACEPVVVGAFVVAAANVRFVLDNTREGVTAAQKGFNLVMVLALGGIAVLASIVRGRRERELALARPAQRLTALSGALAAARSVDEVKEAFARMARAELDARVVRFVLVGEDQDPSPELSATYSASLVVASGDIGRIDIWFDSEPDQNALDVLGQAVTQVAVALSRAQSAQSLAVTARRLAALQRCTSKLAGLLRTADIAGAMVVEARQAVQADRALLFVVDGSLLRVVASSGATASEDDTTSIEADGPLAEAVRSGEVVVCESREQLEAAYPAWSSSNAGAERSIVVAPITGRDGVAAALQLAFGRPHRIVEEERRLVIALTTLIGTAWRRAERFEQEERERAEEAHRAQRAARLAALAATLADARDRLAVAAAFGDHGLAAVDAAWGGIFELDAARRTLHVVVARASDGEWPRGATLPLERSLALTDAVRTGAPVTLSTRAEVEARYPPEQVHPGQRARAAIPLMSYGEAVGVLDFAWDEDHVFDDGEIEFLQTIATRTSEALERGRLHEAEREDERRWNLLAEASARLADAIEPDDVLSALVSWAVPVLADTCAIYLAQPDGTARGYTSLTESTPAGGATRGAADLVGSHRIDLASDHPIAQLHRLRRTLLLDDLQPATIDAVAGENPERIALVRSLAIRHVVAAPLIARNQQLGVLLLTMGRSGRSFAESDIELVSDLAARFSIVYDNAVLFATERNIAARLQSALLPASLTPPPTLDVAVRYTASGSRAGGDWYDLIALSDTSAALVVGDLVGHGVEAAATMSRYRSALRAHARLFEDPGTVMNAYSRFILQDETGQTATVLYCLIDLHPDHEPTLSYCSAGHPPPIVLHEGCSSVLPSPQGPLIGLTTGGYTTRTVPFPRDAAVVLYTDGLFERRGETLDEGTARLEAAIRAIPADDLERFVDDLLVAMAHEQHDDDVAVLAARMPAAPGARVTRTG